MEALAEQGIPAVVPVDALQRDVENVRLIHRAVMYDFTVRYLRARAQDPRTELVRRGYLADTLEVVFPGDRQAQQLRLQSTLRFVYGGPLSRGQIRELFADPQLCPTAALEAEVARLASTPRARRFIAEQSAHARLRHADHAAGPLAIRPATPRRPNGARPRTPHWPSRS